MRDKFYAILMMPMGIFMIIIGITMLSNDKVTCGGSEMSAGDTCVETKGSSRTERTLDEQRSDNNLTGWLLLLGGAGMSTGGVFWTRSLFRKKRPQPAGPGQFAPQQPQMAPPQQWQGVAPPAPYAPQYQQQAYPQQPYPPAPQQPYQQQPPAPQQQSYPQPPYPQQPPSGPYASGPR